MELTFSIIIPVYNRPEEIDELLDSLIRQNFKKEYEILIIEDGSQNTSEKIVDKYKPELNIRYYFKENSGPGDTRNFGMKKAMGNYFIILDSDVTVPPQYLSEIQQALQLNYTDAFGGPDTAHKDFTSFQKAVNYAMTSVLTTGGIRGKKKALGKFQPRSFNFGISKEAFEKTQGFSDMRAGEDIDLTFRLWRQGFETQLIEKAFVYHKRRSTLSQFYKQVAAFGAARPLLNRRYPGTSKLTYWFPGIFIIGFDLAIILWLFGYWQLPAVYGLYLVMIFSDATVENNSLKVGFLSIVTSYTQFLGYGMGFLGSQFFSKK